MFAEHSVIAMLVLAVAGAGLCLLLLRPRQVLATILGVTAAEGMLAANLWAAVLSGQFPAAAVGVYRLLCEIRRGANLADPREERTP